MKISIKRVIMISTMILALILQSGISFAAEDNSIKEKLSKESISSASEGKEVKASLENKDSQLKREFKQLGIKASSVKKDAAYKVYVMQNVNLIEQYKIENNFESLISNEYFWEIPISDDNGTIVSTCDVQKGRSLSEIKTRFKKKNIDSQTEEMVKKNEGKWGVSLIETYMPLEGAAFFSNKDRIVELLSKNGFDNIDNIKTVIVPEYGRTYLLYIKNKTGEYAIPYSKRPDLNTLQNGKVYRISEIMDTFAKIFNDTNNSEDSITGFTGVNQLKEDSTNSHKTLLIFCGILASCVIALAIFIMFRKKAYSRV